VVNNYVGTEGLDEDTHCTDAPVPALREGLADFCNVREGGREGGREEGGEGRAEGGRETGRENLSGRQWERSFGTNTNVFRLPSLSPSLPPSLPPSPADPAHIYS